MRPPAIILPPLQQRSASPPPAGPELSGSPPPPTPRSARFAPTSYLAPYSPQKGVPEDAVDPGPGAENAPNPFNFETTTYAPGPPTRSVCVRNATRLVLITAGCR